VDTEPPSLADCMPVLSAALSSVAIDAGCTLLWSLIHGGCDVSADEATLLIEVSSQPLENAMN
jgi:hypothetical protein